MHLAAGTKLGSYTVVAPLGAGGMGEVYRARDTRLGREVALKVLPQSFAFDAERVARFRREAQVLASLNHTHIAAIYGVDEAPYADSDTATIHFLVLELVEGDTLANRIAGRPLPVDEAIAIARQVAAALEAAHEKGIVHRDLKPANIALTRDGQAKVLDFGLAKAVDPVMSSDLSMSPTLTFGATQAGVILGTAAYMSPEQAKGRAADKRSDVWSFGCVLYEMLTGRRAFPGEDVSDTLATVLKNEPDWTALRADLPAPFRALLEGCLKKDRTQRIGDISTAMFLLNEPRATTIAAATPRTSGRFRPWQLALGGIVVSLLVAAMTTAIVLRLTAPPRPVVARFAIVLPEGQRFTDANRQPISLSPDGTRIVYAADNGLHLRTIGDLESRPIAGTTFALSPAFSPDGESIVFWDRDDLSLKRVAATGGTPVKICATPSSPVGISWTTAGILYAVPTGGIFRVSPNGGTPEQIVAMKDRIEAALGPSLLPDDDTLLFTVASDQSLDRWDKAQIKLYSLSSHQTTTLMQGGSDARYVSTGHIVYAVGGTLFAVPFDMRKHQVAGTPVPVLQGVRRAATSISGAAFFAISSNGSLVYVPGPATSAAGRQLMALFDRNGVATPLKLPPGGYSLPRVSPDGKRIAFENQDTKDAAIWIYDLDGTTSARRLTFGGGNRYPIWSSDGARVAFQSDREGDRGIFWQAVDGGAVERLTTPEPGVAHVPESWLPNGEAMLIDVIKGSVHTLSLLSTRDRKVAPWGGVEGPGPPDAVFSPDGHWVAYQSVEGSDPEYTYVQPFPSTGAKHQIARGGRPTWSSDGKELLFIPGPGQLRAVTVTTQPTFNVTAPTDLTRGFGASDPSMARPFDMAPGGRIVGLNTYVQGPTGAVTAPQMNIVLNWFDELTALAPRK